MNLRGSKRQRILMAENLRFAKQYVTQDLPPALLEQLSSRGLKAVSLVSAFASEPGE